MLSNCRSIDKSKKKKDQRERRRRKRNARENLLVVVRGLGLREERWCFNGVPDAVDEGEAGAASGGGDRPCFDWWFFFSNPFLIFIKKIFIQFNC